VLKGSEIEVTALTVGVPSAIAGDLARGNPSISVSTTGYDGDTFGNIDIP